MPGIMNEDNNYHLDSTWGEGLSSSSVKNTESPCRAGTIVGMSERAGGEKEAPFRKEKKKAENDIAEER